MSVLQGCRVISGLPILQHQLPVLQCPVDSGAEVVLTGNDGVPIPQGCDFGGGRQVRDHTRGSHGAIKKRFTYWPGRGFGVRKPERDETPLSWEEVMLAVRDGILVPLHQEF